MGYTTDFTGKFWLNKPLTDAHHTYLTRFNEVRHMRRMSSLLPTDPFAQAVGLGFGEEGEYFVAAAGWHGQDFDDSILDTNRPAKSQPGLWCKWMPNEKGTALIWDGREKFYEYVKWIEYLMTHFLTPWGYVLDGSIRWQGELRNDYGTLLIEDNILCVYEKERRTKRKKVGYGGLKRRILQEKPTIVLQGNYFLMIEELSDKIANSALFDEYYARIRDVDYETFVEITKEYATITVPSYRERP